jgi:hypothetical protein
VPLRLRPLEGDDKIKMLAVADAWLKVADEIAKEAATKVAGKLVGEKG